MDKEAQEKIETLLSQYSSELLAWKSWGMNAVEKTHDLKIQITKEIDGVYKELGYRKLPKDKPPLVRTDRHLDRIDDSWMKACEEQRDSDMKTL